MDKERGNRFLRLIGWIFVIFLALFILGLMIGAVIGGGNIFTPFEPSTWAHIFKMSS